MDKKVFAADSRGAFKHRPAKGNSLLHRLKAKKPHEKDIAGKVERNLKQNGKVENIDRQLKPNGVEVDMDMHMVIQAGKSMDDTYPEPDYDVHVFYYPWYGNPDVDGVYLHWNHEYLPHWDKEEAKKWPSGRHVPPDDIGSNFYPSLGPYSSRDPVVIDDHMKQIRTAGIGKRQSSVATKARSFWVLHNDHN